MVEELDIAAVRNQLPEGSVLKLYDVDSYKVMLC
jgi:hypothetical protein